MSERSGRRPGAGAGGEGRAGAPPARGSRGGQETAAAERQAESVARRLAVSAARPGAARRGSGELSGDLRGAAERELRSDLSGVRLHTDAHASSLNESAGTQALASESDVYFGAGRFQPESPLGRELIWHELTHVAQLRAGRELAGFDREHLERAEELHAGLPLPVPPRPGLRLGCDPEEKKPQPPPKVVKPLEKLRAGGALSEDEARALMDEYKGLSGDQRDQAVAEFYTLGGTGGGVERLLSALSAEDTAGPYREPVKDLLRRVQVHATRAAAGKTDAEMAQTQADFMDKEATEAAREAAEAEALAKGEAPPVAAPTVEEKREAHRKKVEKHARKGGDVTDWTKLTDEEKAAWNAEAESLRAQIVALAQARVPELGIEEKHIVIEPEYMAKRGSFATTITVGGERALRVGQKFMRAAKADLEYVLPTVIHEIRGHPEFGTKSDSYMLEIYDQATGLWPGYVTPDAEGRKKERSTFGYQGTEIYSELREAPHYKPRTEEHKKAGITTGDNPKSDIRKRVGIIKANWEPGLAKAMIRGLYERYRLDPRIEAASLALFEQAVEHHYPGEKLLEGP